MNNLLFQRFEFKKPIEIEWLQNGDNVIASREKIVIAMDEEAEEKDMAEILSKAKMGEKDPLLVTFYFQKHLTEEEDRYAQMFHMLCQPLLDAWAYKTMRKWVPDVYNKEIEEVSDMCNRGFSFKDTGDMKLRRLYLGYWAILYENVENEAKITLTTDEENRAAWEGYIEMLKELVRMEPDASLCLKLPLVSDAPYSVKIEIEDGFRYFDIRGKKAN